MREFRSLTLREIAEELKRPRDTIITCHVKPDGDCLGSAFALKLLLRLMGSRAWVVCAEEYPHRLEFLLDGEQTSVLPGSIPTDFYDTRIVAVDTASPGQAGTLYELYGEDYSLSIDHHGRGTPFADYYVDSNASATGELIFRLAQLWITDGEFSELPLEAANRIYAAITSDTGSFKYANTTPEALRTAADLVAAGVDVAEVNRRLFSSIPYLQMAAQYEGFRRLRFYENGRIASIVFPYEAKEALGIRDEHTETLVDLARVIEGVEIAFVLKQPTTDAVFRLSTRSAVEFDVSAVCAVFGGGGHVRAAGATISDSSDISDAEQRVLAEILKRL